MKIFKITRQIVFLGVNFFIPRVPYIYPLRALILRLSGLDVSITAKLKYGYVFEPPGYIGNISIGSHTFINTGCRFASRGKITIGKRCSIGPNVLFETVNHDLKMGQKKRSSTYEDIVIEDNVWIGAGVIICPGVTIGNGSVIAAGSVVTNDADPLSLYGGIPSKKIRNLSDI